MKRYVGLGVSQKTTGISVVDEGGRTLAESVTATEPAPIAAFVRRRAPDAVRMVLEHRGEHASEWAGIGRRCDCRSVAAAPAVEPGDEVAEALVERGLGREIYRRCKRVDIGEGRLDVAGLDGRELDLGRRLEMALEDGYEVTQLDRRVVADVVEAKGCIRPVRGAAVGGRRRQRQEPQHGFDHVVDVGEVAAHLAVIEQLDRSTGPDGFGEDEIRHVGAAPWAVDGEEAQTRRRQPVEVAVGVHHELIGPLGRGVEAHRVIDGIALGEG